MTMESEDLRFNSYHSDNVQLYNDHRSARIADKSSVLRIHPALVPDHRYKLIVEGKGKIDVVLTHNAKAFERQTKITLEKATYDTHIYHMHLHSDEHLLNNGSKDAKGTEKTCLNYSFVVEKESMQSDDHAWRIDDLKCEPGQSWHLLFSVEGNISLITLPTEGCQREEQLRFVSVDDHTEHLSVDKLTYRRSIECTEICFGNRLLHQNEEIKLMVMRKESHAVCEIRAISDENFRCLVRTNSDARYMNICKPQLSVVLRNNVLSDPMTSQIQVKVPMQSSGWPVFIFSGCTLEFGSDFPSRGLPEEPILNELTEASKEPELLQQIQSELASLKAELDVKRKDDMEHQKKLQEQLRASQEEAKQQSTSLLEMRDQQSEILSGINDTKTVVKRQTKTIMTKLNRFKTMGKEDGSFEMLRKYISPNYSRINNSLEIKEFMDYLLQYGVLTDQQYDDIKNRNQGEQRCDLLEILRRKPVSYLPEVVKALERSGNKHLLMYFKDT
ncbi:uncharacterized protein LOC132551098 [Ylistrum balloti]|uniref:uncharacterized protein LOC132551098 n=1 Tax=Ylistrum balloti TaxID=509963 RepID=UPI002905F551|nr:uncharacterized protein LOC132551098 [Ylistrum balloti]